MGTKTVLQISYSHLHFNNNNNKKEKKTVRKVEGQKVDFYLFFWIRWVWDQYNKVHGWLQNY